MFGLYETALDPDALKQELLHPRAGAYASFEGWVRDHNDGRSVDFLEYEAFGAMVDAEGERILDEARKRFSLLNVSAVHRIGKLRIGDLAIWVGATAEHRQEAFLAVRWVMDEIKHRLPVWKKEHYSNGPEPVWVGSGADSKTNVQDEGLNPRYAKQTNLREIGAEGQRRLGDASILVVGAGGLGCPALQYLAAAGIGQITIADGDRVSLDNLHRQILFNDADIGCSKAEVAADRLRAMNPHVAVHAISEHLDAERLSSDVGRFDAVLDCTDNFDSKYAIHDACWNTSVPLIQASIHQFDGQVQVFRRGSAGGCFRCIFPEPPPSGCVGNCAEAGVLGATPGLLGTWQAIETIKVLLNLPDVLDNATLWVDVLSGDTRKLSRNAEATCACANNQDFPMQSSNILFPGAKAEELLKTAKVIDLREDVERAGNPDWVFNLTHLPRDRWQELPEHVNTDGPTILACAKGARAAVCLQLIPEAEAYAWQGSVLDLPVT